MIIQTYDEEKRLYRTYSDAGVLIHGGTTEADYGEAWDIEPRTYTETDIPIITDETERKAAAYDILTGVTE